MAALFSAVDVSGLSSGVSGILISFVGVLILFTGYKFVKKTLR